jgi:hypothetical protein
MNMTDAQRQRLDELGMWVKQTCDLYGCEPHTGFMVAGMFTKGLAEEWEKQAADKKGEK